MGIYTKEEKFLSFIILLLSLVVIVKSADVLIDSSAKIARFYGVPTFIIGVSIIAFGTSAPELVVGVASGINKVNQLSFGNIVGSCINNTALIMGITALILTVHVDEKIIKKEMVILTFIEILLVGLVFFDKSLSRIDGLILLVLGIAFIVDLIRGLNNGTEQEHEEDVAISKSEVPKQWILTVVGLIGLIVSGKLIVDSSTAITTAFGIDQSAVGLTLVALGTTMPELIASITAARKKEDDIILGNIIGSNIFNILIILGSSSLINPISIESSLFIDMGIMIIFNLLLYIIMYAKRKISWRAGLIMLLGYAGYMANNIMNMIRR